MLEERRGVIAWLLGGGFVASIISFVYPAIRFMDPPDVPEATVNETSAGKVQEFKPNSGKIVKFGSKPVLLIRVNETDWHAFSAVCTHLNCTVQYQDTRHQIWCACHNGFYT
jgi:Rieske Fe-S protein